MPLQGQLPIRSLDVFFRGIERHIQGGIIALRISPITSSGGSPAHRLGRMQLPAKNRRAELWGGRKTLVPPVRSPRGLPTPGGCSCLAAPVLERLRCQ
mmetsp:Transcript_55524/g.159668  ORF Transcript_55524/g.159668 Transcript_55524/m.159668 type:complete len:98 (-) Transcript_55524:92-385(-)